MMWKFADTSFNTGTFNMDYDLNLVQNFSGSPILRIYQWNPYCISLGANQDFNSINYQKVSSDGIDIVKRPTGGRAILHAEELTYSVVFPISNEYSPKKIYREINLALKNGLMNYNSTLDKIDLENNQPHFPSFYKKEKSNLCFAVSAMNELNFNGKKVVGSAQRKMGDVILQHGSILCGKFHKNIISYLNLASDKIEEIKNEIEHTTTELETILDEKSNYARLAQSIKKGFEDHFKIKFEQELSLETISQVN
jgi:lipoate-protein ligase A